MSSHIKHILLCLDILIVGLYVLVVLVSLSVLAK